MEFYEKNLSALTEVNPLLMAKLFQLTENKKYEVFVDEKDPININIYDKENDFIFYNTKPVDEVQEQFNKLFTRYARYPLVWFFGMANGLLVKMFTNLQESKTVVVFEKEIELIYIALNLFDFSEAIKEQKLLLYLLEDVNYLVLDEICADPDRKVFLKTFQLETTLDNYYLTKYSDDITTLNKQITDVIKTVILREGNDATDSLVGLDHHLQHIPQMIASYPSKDILKQFDSKYAVIVSTGPSLAKQLPLLKKYHKYLTVLCIDASLPILQKEGIAPDFVFSMERVKETSRFFENLDKELLKETIFMITSLTHPNTLKNLKGMRLSISMRPFGYTSLFRLHRWGYYGIGMSAANMAFEFAYDAHFDHIAFIGQDLAFGKDGTTHAKGAFYGEVEENYKKQEEFYVKGYYGDVVKTTKIWKLFLSSFKKDIPVVVEEGIKVYNCTEGGAYIDGAEHIPFAEFLEKVPNEPKKPIEAHTVEKAKQNYYINRSKKIICAYTSRLKKIKEKVEGTFLEVMETIESLEELNERNELEKIDFDRLAQTIEKIDQIKDIYEEDKALKGFNNITAPMIVSAELELARIMVRVTDTEIEKKKKMIDWIYEHKSWLFFLAGALENIIYIMERNYSAIYKTLKLE